MLKVRRFANFPAQQDLRYVKKALKLLLIKDFVQRKKPIFMAISFTEFVHWMEYLLLLI